MFLLIKPATLIFDQCKKSSTVDLTLENTGQTDVRFKFRCPTANVVKVSESIGSISPSKSKRLRVAYFPENNETGDSLIMIQLKYIPIEDGMENTDVVFTSHKGKEETRIISVNFKDKMDDDMFRTPKSSERFLVEDDSPKKETWWQKRF